MLEMRVKGRKLKTQMKSKSAITKRYFGKKNLSQPALTKGLNRGDRIYYLILDSFGLYITVNQ